MSLFDEATLPETALVDEATNENFQKVVDFLNSDDDQMVINGSAGTGKSYLLKGLVEYNILPENTRFTATTNKAASVLSQYLERPVGTIFSLLGLIPKDNYNTGRTELKQINEPELYGVRLVVIDEAYMLTKEVLQHLYKATNDTITKILFIGDSYQLPPVFYKKSPIEDFVIPEIKLSKIYRTGDDGIIDVSQQLRKNVDSLEFKKLLVNDSSVQMVDSVDFINEIVTTFQDDRNIAKIVAWTNNKVLNYNKFVSKLVHGKDDFEVGDIAILNNPLMDNWGKVIAPIDSEVYIENIADYTVTEEDLRGFTYRLSIESRQIRISGNHYIYLANNPGDVKKLMGIFATNKDWQNYFAVKNFFGDIRHPYSCTVHKSQGSTYNTVFIDVYDICKNRKKYEVAKLMYVAATRASDRIVFCENTENIEKEAQMFGLITQ